VVLGRGREAELAEDARHVLLHGALGDHEPVGHALVRPARGHQREHLPLPLREHLAAVAVARTEEAGDDLGIERRAAGRHAPHRLDERADVGDAVLEQAADAARVLGQQREGGGSPTYWLSRSTPVCGRRRRISIAASSPARRPSGAKRMSTIATSGLWPSTLRSRSGASPACAATSTSWSASRRARPSRSRRRRSVGHAIGTHAPGAAS